MRGKIISLCTLLSLFATASFAAWEPVGYETWRDGSQYKGILGGVYNYQREDGTWAAIDTTWEELGDTAFGAFACLLKTTVWKDGITRITINFKGHNVEIYRRLMRFSWLDTVTWTHQTLMNVNFTGRPVGIAGRDCTFDFPGWQFRVRKGVAITAHQIVMEKSFLDSLAVLYDQLPLQAQNRVQLANVYEFQIYLDGEPLNLEDDQCWGRILTRIGRFDLLSRNQRLHFDGYDTLPLIPIGQEWKRIGGQLYFAEFVRAKHLDSLHTLFPNMSLWHAGSDEIQDAGIEDTEITGNVTDLCLNFGSSPSLYIKKGVGADLIYTLIRCWAVHDLALPSGDTINACSLKVNVTGVTGAGTVDVHRVFHTWVEGNDLGLAVTDSGATWKQWNGYTAGKTCVGYEWATLGASCESDNADDYNCDCQICADSTADITDTPMSSTAVSAEGIVKFPIAPSLANDWYSGDASENGVLLKSLTASANIKISATEMT